MGKVNWLLTGLLFCISLPGVWIAMPRIVCAMLEAESAHLKKRFSWLVIVQVLVMVFFMSLAGSFLTQYTGFKAPLLYNFIQGLPLGSFLKIIFPTVIITLGGLFLFLFCYYVIAGRVLDGETLEAMQRFRAVLDWDGAILYGGIVEEILLRWGLMNLLVFFGVLFIGYVSTLLIGCVILVSCFLMTAAYYPAYLAMGCQNSRQFKFCLLLLNGVQTILFSWVFWQYGLLAALVSHMLFHAGWYLYDRV